MNRETSVEELLRWRVARAEAEAPPPPRAAILLERARPWWERWPERFHGQVERLVQSQLSLGYAMAGSPESRGGHAVPALVVRDDHEVGAVARVLYLSVRGDLLRLRFHLETPPPEAEPGFEVTFVSDATETPLFSARATVSTDGEYRLGTVLPPPIAGVWEELKVTDRMPFRLILHSRARSV